MADFGSGQTPGVWPPPPGGPGYGQSPAENTSGTQGGLPPEIAALKWNWGAFLMSFLWSVNHKISWGWGLLVLGLLSRTPYVGPVFSVVQFGLAIYLGVNGHKLGWQNRRFEGGVPQYLEVQQKWLVWGVGVLVVALIFGVIGGAMIGLAGARR